MTKFQKVKPFFIFVMLFIFLLAGSNSVLCKKLPSYENENDYRAEDYPEYEQYIKEYIAPLKKNFEPEKFFTKNMDLYASYRIEVQPDGTFSYYKSWAGTSSSNIKSDKLFCVVRNRYCNKIVKESKGFDKYIEDILAKNPPKAFPKGIECDELFVYVTFYYFPNASNKEVVTKEIVDTPFLFPYSNEGAHLERLSWYAKIIKAPQVSDKIMSQKILKTNGDGDRFIPTQSFIITPLIVIIMLMS